ncbi:MAG: SH3 domain-containing protein [Methanobacteriota archaeon]|nr:MAG: SH3 domain-containing protein [Euryarchaeota archaeon]
MIKEFLVNIYFSQCMRILAVFSLIILDISIGENISIAESIKRDNVYVITSVANVRSGPSTKYDVIFKVTYGKKLKVINRSESWIQIRTEKSQKIGWIYEKLVSSELPTSEQGIRNAVKVFWNSVKYEDWKGILSLFSPEAKQEYYNNSIRQVKKLDRFSSYEIQNFMNTTTDPDLRESCELALIYKRGDLKTYRYKVIRGIAEEVLSRFQGVELISYSIDEIIIKNGVGIARITYKAKKIGSDHVQTLHTTQRFEKNISGKWYFK